MSAPSAGLFLLQLSLRAPRYAFTLFVALLLPPPLIVRAK